MTTAIAKFYDASIRALADQQPPKVRKQLEAAFAKPPQSADDVDPWFLEHFHKAPVSHDTRLFSTLQGFKAELRELAGKPAAEEESEQ